MLYVVALHDELADLRAEVGAQAFEDPVTFRAAFDDFIPEGSATTGEVSLLVGAISTGALQRLKEQLALGADPASSIAAQGDLLARDRGTSDSSGCRWALSVLAHAIGAVPLTQVLTRPSVPGPVGTADRPASASDGDGLHTDGLDTGPTRVTPDERPTVVPTALTDATRVTSDEPPAPPGPGASTGTPAPSGGGVNPLLVGAVVVLAVVAVVAIVLLMVRDGDSDDDPTADGSRSTPAETSTSVATDVVLDEIEMSEDGKTVRVQLVHDGPKASVVLLAERDGDYAEVDRFPVACPYLDISYDAGIQDQGDRQIFFGWANSGTDGYGEYGEVQIDEEMLVPFAAGDTPCATEP